MKDLRHIEFPEDLYTINAWSEAWGGKAKPEWYFPKHGWIIPGIIAAFLWRTDSAICYLEHVISNPEASQEDRQVGLGLIGSTAFEFAKEQGFKLCYGSTRKKSVAMVSESYGMKATEFKYAMLAKVL